MTATKKTAVKKLPAKKVTPAEQIAKLEMNNAILEQSIYMAYDDYDEMFAVLRYVIDDVEKPEFSRYQVRDALKAIRTLMIHNQSMMMDCAGLEY
jgi:undecaprenyl pyrophosphate synthase